MYTFSIRIKSLALELDKKDFSCVIAKISIIFKTTFVKYSNGQ